jgi:hypothetical protein
MPCQRRSGREGALEGRPGWLHATAGTGHASVARRPGARGGARWCSLMSPPLLVLLSLSPPVAAAATALQQHEEWDPSISAYRSMLVSFSGTHAAGVDVPKWAAVTRAAREWMVAHDPDYPTYHLAAPEGWNNDPNGVTFDARGAQGAGLYHRFYQYDKTYSDDCRHGRIKNCTIEGKAILNPASRVWGHTVSRDGATWEDWPGIDADDPKSDAPGVYSGNCAIRDDGSPVCIYSNGHCSIGVCAYSTDWIHCEFWPPPALSVLQFRRTLP